MIKKKIVLMVSKQFPETHSRRGDETEFERKIELGNKIHTIRGNFHLWAHNAEKMKKGTYYLSIRQWSGKPYKSKHKEIFQKHSPIGVQPIELFYHAENDTISAKIDGVDWLDADCCRIAKNDGLSVQDFKEWFFGKAPSEDKVFNGVIIHFTDFRY